MPWLDDIIESLPAKYEALARMYLPVLKRLGREEVLSWIDRLANDHSFYDILVEKMTTAELIADQERSNEELKALNADNAEQVDLGWQILWMLVTMGLDKLEE